MLCDFPDLYDLGLPGITSGGAGAYCLMAAGGAMDDYNPGQICAYLKFEAGWAVSVTELASGMAVSAKADSSEFFLFSKSPTEYFIVENREQAGRDAALPDAGLAIWHVDTTGDNSREDMTELSHYECSLEQADGRFDLERGDLFGDDRDLFRAGWRDEFTDATTPSSKWWDGSSSGLSIRQIGNAGNSISFVVD